MSHVAAIRELAEALQGFLNSGWQSEEGGTPDPDELDLEAVDQGGAIHNAVCKVQPYYPKNKLPAPEARNPWLLLQRACRRECDPLERHTKAHKQAGILRDWCETELARLQPPPPSADADKTPAGYLGLRIDADNRTAERNGVIVEFGGRDKPWRILCRLERAKGIKVSVSTLMDDVWGRNEIVDETAVRNQISELRRLLHGLGLEIKNVRGGGYLLKNS